MRTVERKILKINDPFGLKISSHPEVFYKKGVLKNFSKFTGKHLRQSLFLIKLLA